MFYIIFHKLVDPLLIIDHTLFRNFKLFVAVGGLLLLFFFFLMQYLGLEK